MGSYLSNWGALFFVSGFFTCLLAPVFHYATGYTVQGALTVPLMAGSGLIVDGLLLYLIGKLPAFTGMDEARGSYRCRGPSHC